MLKLTIQYLWRSKEQLNFNIDVMKWATTATKMKIMINIKMFGSILLNMINESGIWNSIMFKGDTINFYFTVY